MIQKEFGQQGEQYVASWLTSQGYTILAHNFTTGMGELDIVATRDEIVAFVEVKTRKDAPFPLSMVVTPSKQHKIIKTAKIFIQKHAIVDKVFRFDVAILTMTHGEPDLNYIPNAFFGR